MAIVSFAGAFPLIAYNLNHDWVTFRSNAAWSSEEIGYKARLLLSTMQGNSISGRFPEKNGMAHSGSRECPKRIWVSTTIFSGGPERIGRCICCCFRLLFLPFVWKTERGRLFYSCSSTWR